MSAKVVEELTPAFDVEEPLAAAGPVVCNSPHSGRAYPASFLRQSRLELAALRRSEDTFVDELFAEAPRAGVPLMRAHFPRAFLDVNREPYELDPRMFEGRLPAFANTRSLRVAGGLGTIARVVGDAREIYPKRIPVSEALSRIEQLYKPYHRTLRKLVSRAQKNCGIALLIDCHSMPSNAGSREERPRADFVLGDRYGTSCSSAITDMVERTLRAQGHIVLRNKPYAGGFITQSHGAPASGRHALQIEINRSLYLREPSLEKSAGFPALRKAIASVLGKFLPVLEAWLAPRRQAAE